MAWATNEKPNEYQRAYRLARGIKPRVPRVAPSCLVCASPVPDANRRYCSARCQFFDNQQRWLDAWLFHGFNPPHAGEGRVPDWLKRAWFAMYGEQCCQCGWAQRRKADGRIPLTWDHADGDCSNNKFENLRLLCPNCHSLTDTYGSLNKLSRRKRWGLYNGRTRPMAE